MMIRTHERSPRRTWTTWHKPPGGRWRKVAEGQRKGLLLDTLFALVDGGEFLLLRKGEKPRPHHIGQQVPPPPRRTFP